MAQRFKTPEDARLLGARLRQARLASGLTLVSLAEKTGVNAGQLSRLERGKMATLSRNVQIICESLGVAMISQAPASQGVGDRIDALLAASPVSEKAVDGLIAALERVLLEATGAR